VACIFSFRRQRRPSSFGFCAGPSSTSRSICASNRRPGHWIAEEISAAGGEQIFIPRGFAHGFYTLDSNTEVAYQIDNYYAPASESGIIWNDPSLNIPWPVEPTEAILSDKGRQLVTFRDLVSPFRYARHADA
jgi:dTDP-4-dehydrorhamnose 3,5-epimerase